MYLSNMQKRGYDASSALKMWNKEERNKLRTINNLNTLKSYSGYSNLNDYSNRVSWRAFLNKNPYNQAKHGSYKNYLIDMKQLRNQPANVPQMLTLKSLSSLMSPTQQIMNRSSELRQVSNEARNMSILIDEQRRAEKKKQENMERFIREQEAALNERKRLSQLQVGFPLSKEEEQEMYFVKKMKDAIWMFDMRQLYFINGLNVDDKFRTILSATNLDKRYIDQILNTLTPAEKQTGDDALKNLIGDVQEEKKYTAIEVEQMKMKHYPRNVGEHMGAYKHRIKYSPMPPTIMGKGFSIGGISNPLYSPKHQNIFPINTLSRIHPFMTGLIKGGVSYQDIVKHLRLIGPGGPGCPGGSGTPAFMTSQEFNTLYGSR
jgi:hypothetical protein